MRHRHSLARLLLALFLIASLPLRGYAMGMLAPQVAQTAEAVVMHASMSDEHAMHEHAMHEHYMHMHASHAHAHDALPAQPIHPHHGSSACGPCADCCTAGTLQSLPLAVRAPLAPHRVEVRPVQAPASFIADLLVPPPNPLAA